MKNFSMDDLASWEQIPTDQGISFAAEAGVPHRVRGDLVSVGPIAAYVTDESGERKLVAFGSGRLRVKATVVGAAELYVVGPEDVESEVWLRRRSEPQVRPESDLPSFATIQPRGVGPSSDVRRMMMMLQLNADRREKALRGELERLGSRYEAARRDAVQARSAKGSRAVSDAETVEEPPAPRSERRRASEGVPTGED